MYEKFSKNYLFTRLIMAMIQSSLPTTKQIKDPCLKILDYFRPQLEKNIYRDMLTYVHTLNIFWVKI